MGIYIKGVEMPENCETCWNCDRNFNIGDILITDWMCLLKIRFVNGRDRPDWCPLVPVPEHGRLIEESKVLDIVSAWCPDDDGSVGKVGDLREMLDEIEALPTIILAEEEEKRN